MASFRDKTREELERIALERGIAIEEEVGEDDEGNPIMEPIDTDELIEEIVDSYSDEELEALPEVAEHEGVRSHREDMVDAALGHVIEAEREESARVRASELNARASEDE